MNSFSQGMSKIRMMDRVYETVKDLLKYLKENAEDIARYQKFEAAIKKEPGCDPNNPTLDDNTATFYDTKEFSFINKEGKEIVGVDAMQQVLNAAGIPNASFTVDGLGTTVVAVPKAFAAQANQALAGARIHNVSKNPIQQAQIPVAQKLLANATQQPAKSVVAALVSGKTNSAEFDSARYAAVSERMEQAGIPHAITRNDSDNTYIITYDSVYQDQVNTIDQALIRENPPLELSYADFMRENLGKQIVTHENLTPAQAQYLRTEFTGSCLGYNLEKKNDGSYTLRYNAERANIVEPAYLRAVVRANEYSAHAQTINEQAKTIELTSETARENIRIGQKQMIVDATRPDDFYVVSERGMSDASGKLLISSKDPKFEATVQATIMKMESPMVRATDKDPHRVTDVFTKEEIAKASERFAQAHPSEAEKVASKLLTLKVQTSLTAHNGPTAEFVNDVNNFCKTMSRMASEEGHKFSADEVARQTGMHNGQNSTPDLASQMAEQFNQMNDTERRNFVNCMEHTATVHRALDMHNVGAHEYGAKDLNHVLDNMEHVQQQRGRGDITRGMGHDANGDGEHQAHEEFGGEGLSEDYHRDEDDQILGENVLDVKN